ncbi:MAG: hypothetical protein IPK66_06545 [Rhodospirillales bacterium]|nr:hypothetical protein [Rhodospirillales bacterium]
MNQTEKILSAAATVVAVAATGAACPVMSAEIMTMLVDPELSYLVPPETVLIHNATGGEIVFSLAPQGGEAAQQRMRDGEIRQFSDGVSITYVIEIPTAGRGAVRYRLRAEKRYQVFWNATAQKWDVVELEPR